MNIAINGSLSHISDNINHMSSKAKITRHMVKSYNINNLLDIVNKNVNIPFNTPVRPDGDHPRPYGDRTATRKCTRSPANVNTTREKVSKKYKLIQSCVLTATCAIIPRSHGAPTTTSPLVWRFLWDLWARQRRSRAIPRRSHHDHGVLTTRLLRVSRVYGDLRVFLPRSHGDYILSGSNFSEFSRWSLCSHTAQ